MKKLYAFILVLSMALCLLACTTVPAETAPSTQKPTEPAISEPMATQPADPPSQAPMFSISLPILHQEVTHSDGSTLFSLTYQEISLIHPDPDVADKIIVHYLNLLDAVQRDAESIRFTAEADYTAQAQWQPYSCANLFSVKRIDSNVLSLHGTYSSYNGTSHPTHISQSVSYDLITGDYLTLDDILSHKDATAQVRQLLINTLNAIKEDKQLYPDFDDIVFDLLGFGDFSNWYFSDEGLCFCFSPYEIAPYAAGTVEATIPYTQLTGILKDAYFPMEWAYEGNVLAELFDDADVEQFTQSSEVILHNDGTQFLLHSGNTAVSNVHIEYGSILEDNRTFLPEASIFACAFLTPGDAIVLQCALEETDPHLRITYQSGAQVITGYILQGSDGGPCLLTNL